MLSALWALWTFFYGYVPISRLNPKQREPKLTATEVVPGLHTWLHTSLSAHELCLHSSRHSSACKCHDLSYFLTSYSQIHLADAALVSAASVSALFLTWKDSVNGGELRSAYSLSLSSTSVYTSGLSSCRRNSMVQIRARLIGMTLYTPEVSCRTSLSKLQDPCLSRTCTGSSHLSPQTHNVRIHIRPTLCIFELTSNSQRS